MFLAGSHIGIFGNGQLGRMIALAAKPMGYRVHVFGPDVSSPAAQVADVDFVAPYTDRDAVEAFARRCDVLTLEFENVPVQTIEWAEAIVPVHPSSRALRITQNRIFEKNLCVDLEIAVPFFTAVDSLGGLREALRRVGFPAVLKTATLGYDGKGQAKIGSEADIESAWANAGSNESILEAFIDFEKEISVVAARGMDGSFAHWGVIENVHGHHILDTAKAPASLDDQTADRAVDIAKRILDELGIVGVACVEMFLTRDGEILVNEIAPRVHNSGHLTIEASFTSQFEQHVRAICGLPFGDTRIRPSAMANLLGNLWAGDSPNWVAALGPGDAKVHIYGKSEPRGDRKMGHVTCLGRTADEALTHAIQARTALRNEST